MLRRTCSDCVTTSKPATVAEPSVGFSSVVSMRSVVVLPAPFGPRNPTTDSRRNSRQRCASTVSSNRSDAVASAARDRRNPRLGTCDHGTGPWPFHPLRRSMSRERW